MDAFACLRMCGDASWWSSKLWGSLHLQSLENERHDWSSGDALHCNKTHVACWPSDVWWLALTATQYQTAKRPQECCCNAPPDSQTCCSFPSLSRSKTPHYAAVICSRLCVAPANISCVIEAPYSRCALIAGGKQLARAGCHTFHCTRQGPPDIRPTSKPDQHLAFTTYQ